MPVGTPVDRMYRALMRDGYSQESAVRIAQSQTGTALATGKPPKGKSTKAGALAYPTWATQSQKVGGEENDMMELPSDRLVGKYNPNHDERGRFTSGPGGGSTRAPLSRDNRLSGGGRSSLKALRASFHNTLKERKKLDKGISILRDRMSQFKRNSPSYKRAVVRMQSLKLQRTELTRDLNHLSSAIARRAGPQYHQDWFQSVMSGLPVIRQTSGRPSRKSADADLFEIRRHLT